MSTLPPGWIDTRFEAIADIQLGKMLDKAKNVGLSTAYLRNINIRWGKVETSDVLTMPMSNEDRSKYTINDGDVLVCEGGEPGRAAVWSAGPTELKFQKAIMRVRAAGGISPDWLAQYLRLAAQDGTLSKRFTGTTIKHLPREALQATHLPLPPIGEQRRIVAKIESLSAKSKRARDHLKQIDFLVARYKQEIVESAFHGEIVRLGDICDIQSGLALGKSRSNTEPLIEIPYLRVANVQRGFIDLNNIKTLLATPAEANRLALKFGDILMNEGGDRDKLGRGWVWEGQVERCIHQNHVFRARLKDVNFPSRYVSYYTNEIGRKYFLDEGKQTTNLASVSKSKLAAMPIPIPSSADAWEIVRRIETAFAWIDRLAAEATSARALIDRLDQAVLAKAFRGELVPQDPADEPASVLLERIRAERVGAPAPKRRGRPRAPALP